MGVTGIGLAKACRRNGVPVPPRGYWAGWESTRSLRVRYRLQMETSRLACVCNFLL